MTTLQYIYGADPEITASGFDSRCWRLGYREGGVVKAET
jgi:hypothetical protein